MLTIQRTNIYSAALIAIAMIAPIAQAGPAGIAGIRERGISSIAIAKGIDSAPINALRQINSIAGANSRIIGIDQGEASGIAKGINRSSINAIAQIDSTAIAGAEGQIIGSPSIISASIIGIAKGINRSSINAIAQIDSTAIAA
jgi:hypothetical protein